MSNFVQLRKVADDNEVVATDLYTKYSYFDVMKASYTSIAWVVEKTLGER